MATNGFKYQFKDFAVELYPAGKREDVCWLEGDLNNTTQLQETVRYNCRVTANGTIKPCLPLLPNEGNNQLKVERDENVLTFQFINYLGYSQLDFGDGLKIEFEVVPIKMDYKDDYMKLTESIANHCSQLLLDYSGVTYHNFVNDEKKKANLLEQFIFLRQFCYADNLQSLFESIKRNPDRRLETEEEFKPFGQGVPSQKFYSNPFTYGRNWQKAGDGFYPSEIAVTRKYDSLNTPANRFIKFALQQFQEICDDLIKATAKDDSDVGAELNEQAECCREAKQISGLIDDILQGGFFDDVAELREMPQNNQVLQKREGYCQIFNAFSMVDLALQLEWHGKDEVYKGEAKNVALLYEYWLFFELYNIVNSVEKNGVTADSDNAIKIDDSGKLVVSLCEGQKSVQKFHLTNKKVRVNLYYNKTFKPQKFKTSKYAGSYSRPFRPDYTLAIYPDSFTTENAAVEEGAVSFVHFDAKYRITDISSLIGNKPQENNEDDENVDKSIADELNEEKIEATANTYKRGDLLKMHTYNDAIRRTIGSYVLYPGDSKEEMRLFEEILPGVGAFAVKPSIIDESRATLQKFIVDIIDFKCRKDTRLARREALQNIVVQEPSTEETVVDSGSGNNELCLIGYLRPDYVSGLNLQAGSAFKFYYYAINNGFVYTHHKDSTRAKYFRFYSNAITQADGSVEYNLSKWLCEVKSTRLVSKDDLKKELGDGKEHKADFYFLSEIEVVQECAEKTLSQQQIKEFPGNDTLTPHTPKVVDITELF